MIYDALTIVAYVDEKEQSTEKLNKITIVNRSNRVVDVQYAPESTSLADFLGKRLGRAFCKYNMNIVNKVLTRP